MTLADLAARLGVSTATVSNALTGKGRMQPALRRRILETAALMGYHPKAAADASAGMPRIAMLIEQPGVSFSDGIARGAWDAAADQGIDVQAQSLSVLHRFRTSSPDAGALSAVVRRLLSGWGAWLDGLLYVAQYPRDVEGLLPALPFPAVYAYCSAGEEALSVHCDDRQGAYLATQHLLAQGRRRIAMISGPIDSMPMSNRLMGYQRALFEEGLAFDPGKLLIGDWQMESGYALMRRLLDAPERPDAVFAQNDAMALGALRAVQDSGLRIPEDIALVGFDNEMSAYTTPALSTVDPLFEAIGRRALEQLLRAVRQEALPQIGRAHV